MSSAVSLASALPVTCVPDSNEKMEKIMSRFKAIVKQSVRSDHFYSPENMLQLLQKYSVEDLMSIFDDFCEIGQQTFEMAQQWNRDYLVTAGSPASGKSTVLEKMLEHKRLPHEAKADVVRAYIDPDRSCLQRMQHTYLEDIRTKKRSPQEAYDHWREASNFLSSLYLAKALNEGYAIAHGSTMATPHAINALRAIKNQYGYHVTLVHMTCDPKLCQESEVERRKTGVVQYTDQDLRDKGKLFLEQLADYINPQNVDTVLFYYRSRFSDSQLVAKLSLSGGLMMYAAENLGAIVHLHNQAVQDSTYWERSLLKAKKALCGPQQDQEQVVPEISTTST